MTAAPAPSQSPAVCGVHELSFGHPGVRLFDALSFEVRPGLTLIRGGEGRGKTTLLHLLAGRLQPERGQVLRPASTSVYHETPGDAVHDPVVARDWLAARREQHPGWNSKVEAALIEGLRLGEHIDKPLYMLSTGSRRKVGLVGAAASAATLTLIDTPHAALDLASSRVVNELLHEAAHDRRRAWVLADYERPGALADVTLAGQVDLGD